MVRPICGHKGWTCEFGAKVFARLLVGASKPNTGLDFAQPEKKKFYSIFWLVFTSILIVKSGKPHNQIQKPI